MLADLYLDAGYELVVFEFVFNSRLDVARFRDQLSTDVPVQLLTLWVPLRTVQEREAARPGREPLGQRAKQCWQELRANLDDLGTIIDATRPVEAIVRSIGAELTQGGSAGPASDRLPGRRAFRVPFVSRTSHKLAPCEFHKRTLAER